MGWPWSAVEKKANGNVVGGDYPLRLPLAAWWDSRTDAQITFGAGTAVTTWASRAGSWGAVTWTQPTTAFRATRVASVAAFGDRPALLFDGVDDRFVTSDQNVWKVFHDGTGAELWAVLRVDSTLADTQCLFASAGSAAEAGLLWRVKVLAGNGQRVANGSGTYTNAWNNVNGAEDVTQWRSFGYIDELASQHSSGSSTTNADTAGQEPSAANPTRVATLGASIASGFFKGHVAQVIAFTRQLTTAERSGLGLWSRQQYGVAA